MLLWLMLTGLAVFAAAVAIDQGLVWEILKADRSRLCIVIALLYLGTAVHCARHTWLISLQLNQVRDLSRGGIRRNPEGLRPTPSNPPELIMYQREAPYNSVSSGLWIKGNDTNASNIGLADGLTGKKPIVPGLVGIYE